MQFAILSAWCNTWHSVEPVTYIDNFVPRFTGFFQWTAQQLLLKRQGHSPWDFLHLQIRWDQTTLDLSLVFFWTQDFVDHLFLALPRSFDSSIDIISGASKTFEVYVCVKVSNFNKKSGILCSPQDPHAWLVTIIYFLTISSIYSMWIIMELVKSILCFFISILSWYLNIVLGQVKFFTSPVVYYSGQPSTRILNYLFDSFS